MVLLQSGNFSYLLLAPFFDYDDIKQCCLPRSWNADENVPAECFDITAHNDLKIDFQEHI